MKFGIIREGKVPVDKRVPLTPRQCRKLREMYSDLEIWVQPSDVRAFSDDDYRQEGLTVQEDLSSCDVLLGVKEVPVEMLIPGKTYLFFSHTYKKQPYNRDLLRAILDKKIRLIDYEMLREPGGKRLIGFGRYAGIVGAYNAFRAWGELSGSYRLKPAHLCQDRRELETELIKVELPQKCKILLTGAGKVAAGAMEMLSALRLTQVFPNEYLKHDFDEPVFTQISEDQYFKRKDERPFSRYDFYADPEGYESDFMKFARMTDIYITGHFWSNRAPRIFSPEDVRSPEFNIKLVSDISCDINGPVASTIRPSTIEEPFYGYDSQGETEVPFGTKGSIGVSAVDNLPCELPRDASEDFGNALIKNVIPHFLNGDPEGILDKAAETTPDGKLSAHFAYLEDYVANPAG